MKDEYIRKQDAVDAFNRAVQDVGILDADDIETVFGMLSSADVAPVVHAYWRDTGSGQECSACKEIQYGYDTGRHYCANCGAKMGAQGEE